MKLQLASVLIVSSLVVLNCAESTEVGDEITRRSDGFLTTRFIESEIKSNFPLTESGQCEYRLRTSADDPVFYPTPAIQFLQDSLKKNQSAHIALNCPVDEMGTTTHYFVDRSETGTPVVREITLRKSGKAYGFHASINQRVITSIESNSTSSGETVLKLRSDDGRASAIAASSLDE